MSPMCFALAACSASFEHHPKHHHVPFGCALDALLGQIGSVSLLLESTYANFDQDASVDDVIVYKYTITNNGLLTLYNIAIEDIVVEGEDPMSIECIDTDGGKVDGSSLVQGLASYPSDGLAPAGSLTCSATGSVSRAEVRLAPWGRSPGGRGLLDPLQMLSAKLERRYQALDVAAYHSDRCVDVALPA